MLLWVRRIHHAVRSGRFRLSPGEVKSPRFKAADGHKYICLDALTFALGSYLEYGTLSPSQRGRDLRYIFMALNVSVEKTFQAGWSLSALKRTTSTEMIWLRGSHTVPIFDGSALHHAILRSAGRELTVPPQRGKDGRASRRKHQCCADLTSCGALVAAVTAALAADLGLDIFAISVSLAGCSDGRSLSVFRRMTSWHVRFTVLVSRSLWSEVRTAASNIVEDIALCDQGVNATVAQSMQVMAFFLSNTTTGDPRVGCC